MVGFVVFPGSWSLNWQIYILLSMKGKEEEGVSRADALLECLRGCEVLK